MTNGHNVFNQCALQCSENSNRLRHNSLKSTTIFPYPEKIEIYNGENRNEERGRKCERPLKLPQLNFSLLPTRDSKRVIVCVCSVIWTESPLQSVPTPVSPGGAVPSAFLIGFSLPVMQRLPPRPPPSPPLTPSLSASHSGSRLLQLHKELAAFYHNCAASSLRVCPTASLQLQPP